MTQGILPFKYEEEKRGVGLTALGGLPLYLDLIHAMGLRDSIEKHMKIGANKKQGFTDSEVIISLMMLNLAGGESVEDMRILEEDEGFRCILEKMQNHGVPRSERRRLKTRWRKERKRVTPSPASIHRYLSEFANTYKSRMGESKIPETSSNLRDLILINKDIIAFIQKQCEKKIATLDMDATLIETLKAEALYCYKGFKAYQPFNVFWAEHK
ncbi:IS1380 family transposase, partial [Desulfobotulus mexicanus]